jgi:hypothetical protein
MWLFIRILTIGWLILTVASGIAQAFGIPPAEQKKIESLILGVEQMTNAEFIRNGKNYKASIAAEFLRRKWKARQTEVRSATDFIDKVASFSSTTGKPYFVRWNNGQEKLSAEYFRAQLSLLEGRSVKQSS